MMVLYSDDENILDEVVQFQFKDESGADFGGISRDVFSSFWKECAMRFLEGNDDSFVPQQKGISDKEFITLGKIIHHGFVLTGYFPIILNNTYIEAMLLGVNEVAADCETLLKGYIKYLGPYEGSRLSKMLSLSILGSEDLSFFMELESRVGIRTTPGQHNLKDLALQMARCELLDLPLHTMGKINNGMTSSTHGENLWSTVTKEEIKELYQIQSPDPQKVAALLVATRDDLSLKESKSFDFLKRYVATSTLKRCATFLKFCTGSSSILVKNISVAFFESTSVEPLPKAHTCGAVIELPSNGYTTFNAFKMTMDSLLENQFSFHFTFQ